MIKHTTTTTPTLEINLNKYSNIAIFNTEDMNEDHF